jgi:hypothetical protein
MTTTTVTIMEAQCIRTGIFRSPPSHSHANPTVLVSFVNLFVPFPLYLAFPVPTTQEENSVNMEMPSNPSLSISASNEQTSSKILRAWRRLYRAFGFSKSYNFILCKQVHLIAHTPG